MYNIDDVLSFLETKLADTDPAQMKMCAGIRANAVVNIYRKTGNERAKTLILKLADMFVEADSIVMLGIETMEYTAPLIVLFAAFDITKDEKYKNRIIELEKSDLYTGLAFDMMYETYFGGKERYHAITVAFKELDAHKNDTEMGQAVFMEALIDTVEAINQPVYELYRALVDLFRANAKELLIKGSRPFEDEKANCVFAYAVKKACDMKVLLAEKYEAQAVEVLKGAERISCVGSLAYSQMLEYTNL